jgi:hypothetical protein
MELLKQLRQLNEDSQLSFLDIDKKIIHQIHKAFDFKADTPFKPCKTKAEIKTQLQDGEILIGFNNDKSAIVVGNRNSGGVYSRTKYGWAMFFIDSTGKRKDNDWKGNVADTVNKIATYDNVFCSVDANYDKTSSSRKDVEAGYESFDKVSKELTDRFGGIVEKVSKKTIEEIDKRILELVKAGDSNEVKKEMDGLKALKDNIFRVGHGGNGAKYRMLQSFMRTEYKRWNVDTYADLGWAMEQEYKKGPQFMLNLGKWLLRVAKQKEGWWQF